MNNAERSCFGEIVLPNVADCSAMSVATIVDLAGTWRIASVDAELRRSGADPDLDDSAWPTISIPGHWGEHPDFIDRTGTILHRRRFSIDPGSVTGPDDRFWLTLDGVIGQSDIWLDGHVVGATNDYFAPHRFEITELVRAGADQVVTVEVSSNGPSEGRSKQAFTGSLETGPLAPPGSNGGIWRGIRIERTGPIAIRHARVVCTKATLERAELSFRLVLDVASSFASSAIAQPTIENDSGPETAATNTAASDRAAAETATAETAATETVGAEPEEMVHTSILSPSGEAVAGASVSHQLAAGENRIEWTVDVDEPELWWPKVLGDQARYDISVAVGTSDRREWRTGLRSVSADKFQWRVNGRRLFAKGIAIGPQNRFLARITDEQVRRDVRSAQAAGLDLIRVHGHVAPPALYDEADRLGMLVWQDLPLVGGYATSARGRAQATAREAVDLLGHHPSVAAWCAHDEPNGTALPEPAARSERLPSFGRSLGRHMLPSWNRSVLDPILRRELRNADKSRTVIARSGSLPALTDTSASDPHLWLGWHNGMPEDLPELLKSWPRLGQFLGGFGTQSVAINDWGEDEPTWETAQAGAFERYLPRRAYADGISWSIATRAYQADLIRVHIETLRRLKYRPTGGFCLTALADAEPSGGFGVLGHDRRPKPALDALTDVCRPVIVVTDMPPAVTTIGDRLSFPVHAVSDLQEPLDDVRVTATARCGDWSRTVTWGGELDADTCALIGTLSFDVPDVNGPLTVDLELRADEWSATNRYQTVVIPPSETLHATV